MTKPKPLPEIEKCVCGRKGALEPTVDNIVKKNPRRWVTCWNSNTICWNGPIRKSKRAAILAWNRVMRRPTPPEKS